MAKQVLELSTSNEPDFIVIDGQRYPLAIADDWSTREAAVLKRKVTTLQELEKKSHKEDLTEEEADKADAFLEDLFKAVAPSVPDDVAAKLKSAKKGQIVIAFFTSVAESRGLAVTPPKSSESPSSPASSASTAGQ